MNANFLRGQAETTGDECRRWRERLCAGATPGRATRAPRPQRPERPELTALDAAPDAMSRHLASCPGCAAFARRLELVRAALAAPPPAAVVEPDPHFAARVLARLARPSELIGWAAFRALPAALGLALALAWLGLTAPTSPTLPAPATAAASPLLDEPPSSEQLLAWSSMSPEVWP